MCSSRRLNPATSSANGSSFMQAQRSTLFVRFVVIPFVSLGLLSGCYKWTTPSESIPEVAREDAPDRMRITLLSGDTLELWSPELRGDSIAGLTQAENTAPGDSLHVIALADVTWFEVRGSDTDANLGIALGVVALGLGVIAAVGLSKVCLQDCPP